jgi:hypothetical protein
MITVGSESNIFLKYVAQIQLPASPFDFSTVGTVAQLYGVPHRILGFLNTILREIECQNPQI